LGAWKG